MRKLLTLLFPDRRTPEQRVTDGIRKQVGAYRSNRFKLFLSHTIRPNGFRIDHKPEQRRTFH